MSEVLTPPAAPVARSPIDPEQRPMTQASLNDDVMKLISLPDHKEVRVLAGNKKLQETVKKLKIKPGEFFLGYPDEMGLVPPPPQPEVLSRNGSFLAYFRMQEHVGVFRDFLAQQGKTPEEQELVAAKLRTQLPEHVWQLSAFCNCGRTLQAT